MVSLDVIIICTINTNDIDTYRTIRSLNKIEEDIEIVIHKINLEEKLDLNLKSELCMFMVSGDIIESNYIKALIYNYNPHDSIIMQPNFTYSYNYKVREISKNIDVNPNLASYDVFAIRFYASRHYVSQTSELQEYIQNNERYFLSKNFLWSYLQYLFSKNFILICLIDTITFENIESNFDNKNIKLIDTDSACPPKIEEGYSYQSVLQRQNIDNINVLEKKNSNINIAKPKLKAKPKPVSEINRNSGSSNSVEKVKIESDNIKKKKVSEYNISEAIESDGLVKGISLTAVRLMKRIKDRSKSKNLSVKEKAQQTKVDIKSTLNIH